MAIGLRWGYTPQEIKHEADLLITYTRSIYDRVGQLKYDELSYDNTIKALGSGQANYFTRKNQLVYLQHVAPNKDVREASVVADKKLSELEVELSLREDVFLNFVASLKKFGHALKPEPKRFLERMIKLGQRNGLELPKPIQNEIKALELRIRNLEIDFSKNLNEENTYFYFSPEELVGLPSDFLNGLKKEEGKLEVTLKYPHYFPCMMFAKNPNIRKKLETAFNSRCIKENTPLLEELVKLRQKKASLLNFPNHSAFILDMRMAKNPEKVSEFLSTLEKKIKVLKDQEIKTLLEYKKEECLELDIDFDGKINLWDLKYYMARIEERKYSVDQNNLKNYFPLNQVTKGLLQIYQDLLGLKFELVEGAKSWHEDVEMYSVKDLETGKLMGYFYLDLFPREGKYGHACCVCLQPGCLLENGERQIHVAAMLTNFTKPTKSQPSLLLHSEVLTYFHEFGHVMHHLCSEAEFALFSGTKVEGDFIEAPSQMLENWVWCIDSLMMMSGHYQDHSPIPEDLLKSLIISKNANAGLLNCRQILLATYDQTIHGDNQVDIVELFDKLMDQILGIRSTLNTFMPSSFGHLAGGYDAQYYGYLWSEVYSDDMFHSKFEKNVLDGNMGREYRRCILKPGGSMDASDLLYSFLGREPTQEPFLRSKGLQA